MSRKPDYDVNAMRKDTNDKNRIGAAWKNHDDSIAVVLNSFVVLTAHKELLITLFPVKRAPS